MKRLSKRRRKRTFGGCIEIGESLFRVSKIVTIINLFIVTNMARDLFTVLQVPHPLLARTFRPEHFHVIRTFLFAMARILTKPIDILSSVHSRNTAL